jgi:hypothetical protein
MKTMLAVTVGLILGAPQANNDPIKLHPDNPRYFLWRGNPTVLVTSGEHYGAVLNLDFDTVTYLNALQSAGLNLTRTFTGMYLEGWGEPWNTLNPPSGRLICPWARSSTPGYADGGNKFDLNQWDAGYFTRLKDFVAQAGSRGIVVEIVLFCAMYGDAQWNLSPLKSSNNVNGVGNVAWDQVFNLSNAAVTEAGDAMTAKIVTELNAYDNVYYELCNEPYFGNATRDWHAHVAQKIVDTEASLPKKHLIAHNIANGSTTVPSPIPAVSIFNFHYSSPPDSVAQNYGLNKVVAFDETGFRGATDAPYRKEAWDFIVAGGAVYDNLDWSYSVASEGGNETNWDKNLGGGGPTIRAQLKILKDFIHGFDFIRMAPGNGVIKGGLPGGVPARALVETGKQYAIYLNGGSQSNLVVELPAGNYRAEWVNTKNGNVDRLEDFAHGGGNRTLPSPSYSEDIALRIRNAQGGNLSPSVSLTAPAAGATFAAGADIPLAAAASDSDGSVARVEFYQGTSKIGEDSSSPYGMTWNDVPAGVYTLTAKAIDDDGGVAISSPVTVAVGATFYRAVNLNGAALTIDGNAWEGKTASDCTFTGSSFENQAVTLSPPTDANRASMIRSSVWNSAGSNVTLSAVPDGTYLVYLYVWEDNSSQTYDISLEGQVVQAGYSSGPGGHWDRLGPWSADIADGTISVACSPADANLSGIEVWTLSATPPPPPPPPPTGKGLTGNYFNNMDLTSPVLSREDATIDFDWGAGSPDPSIGADTFSVRWTGLVTPLHSETCTFTTTSDDGVRLWVAGQLLVNHWDDHGPAEDSGTIALQSGRPYEVVMEYYENGGGAVARLAWSSPGQAAQVIPADRFSSSDPRDNDGDGTSNSLDPDDDNDGIPDLQDDDQDGDGVSSAAELAAGTDPQDSSSTPGSGAGSGVLTGDDGGGNSRCGATGAECLILLGFLGILRKLRRD